MNLTRAFADHMQFLYAKGLSQAACDAARQLLLDGLSIAFLGIREAGPAMLAKLAWEEESKPIATLIGDERRVSGPAAARINGAAMHVLDYEPMWNPANHALSTTLPAILALAEMVSRRHPSVMNVPPPTGLEVLTALAIGIEAQARLRLASGQFEPGELIFHPPGAVGPLGSAVACGLLLRLDSKQLCHAIGISASRAGTILANVGSMTKAAHCGQAAAAGLESALLAYLGFTADVDALAGPRGYGRAFYGEKFAADVLTAPHEMLHIVEPGPAYKFFPSQYGTHFVIDAALKLRPQLSSVVDILRVRIVSPSMPYVNRPAPVTGLDGKFSMQYTGAIALLDGAVNVSSFTNERRFADDVCALLQKTHVEVDGAREGRFDRMQLDLIVELQDGRALCARSAGPMGSWGQPFPVAKLHEKIRDCLSVGLSHAKVDDVIRLGQQFDQLALGKLVSFLEIFAK